jgi:LacI family transcriptional regulator
MPLSRSEEAQEYSVGPILRKRAAGALPMTMSDVARRAGVSPMTVSRVINGRQGVSDPVRAHVKAVIADVGYSPNLAARALSGRRGSISPED